MIINIYSSSGWCRTGWCSCIRFRNKKKQSEQKTEICASGI